MGRQLYFGNPVSSGRFILWNLWFNRAVTHWKQQVIALLSTALVGIAAGLIASGFHAAMVAIFNFSVAGPSRWPLPVFAGVVLVVMTAAAAVTGWLMKRFAPDAPGSGIPQVKVAYHTDRLDFSWKLIVVKFVGGVLSIGTGSSLGREGPTIHLGAAIGSKISRFFGERQEARANAVCAGSAAGLAAAFGSPLAGMTLVLEEIAGGKMAKRISARCLLAAALAVYMVYLFTGEGVALPIGDGLALSTPAFWLSPVVAIVAGFAGIVFQWLTLALRARSRKWKMPMPARLAVGAFWGGVAAILAFAFTGHLGVFGLGEQDLHAALNNQILWKTAAILLVAKLVATALCYGTSGCGGIFAPIIFFGGMAGLIVHGVAEVFVPLTAQDQTVLALVGMTSCLGAVVQAPITSILIVVEMTSQLAILPALMVGAVISTFLNRVVFGENFYSAALRQDGVKLDED